MLFDCSFAEYGNYSEMGNAWESMQINSISVVPDSAAAVETIYCADASNMTDVGCIIVCCVWTLALLLRYIARP